jgi:hemoglobin-like flavoprotein
MSSTDRELVQESWALVVPRADALAQAFYARLFDIDPSCRQLFGNTDMTSQRRKLTDMLTNIVRAIDEPQDLVPVTASLGRRHAGYHVKERDYVSVGEALLWALHQTLGDAFTPAMGEAWLRSYTLLSALMQRGAARMDGDGRAHARTSS